MRTSSRLAGKMTLCLLATALSVSSIDHRAIAKIYACDLKYCLNSQEGSPCSFEKVIFSLPETMDYTLFLLDRDDKPVTILGRSESVGLGKVHFGDRQHDLFVTQTPEDKSSMSAFYFHNGYLN